MGTPYGKIVWATGWAGMQEIGGNGVKGQAALLRHDAAGAPQLFADALHIIPHLDGTVAIGSTSERDFTDPTSTDSALDDAIARAVAAFPVLQGAAVIETWAGVRPRAPSRAPVLGDHPIRKGEYIANGGFYHFDPAGDVNLTLYGLVGISAGVKSGLEVHLFGLVAGLDFRNPGIKVPAFGRFGS